MEGVKLSLFTDDTTLYKENPEEQKLAILSGKLQGTASTHKNKLYCTWSMNNLKRKLENNSTKSITKKKILKNV